MNAVCAVMVKESGLTEFWAGLATGLMMMNVDDELLYSI